MTSHPTIPSDVATAPASAAFGPYVRMKLLGEGGFGQVWKAWDRPIGRWVALKIMKGGGDERRARFEREARLAANLEHSHIAHIYAVGEQEGVLYIAMQFIEGMTLRKWQGSPHEAARLIRDAARAVQFAHERGIVHRDLKPENLMAAGDHLYVMDFGLARDVDGVTLTASGVAVGTPSYMPPEQARGERATPVSDVYSLGATLYELVTGRLAFAGSNVLDIMLAVCGEEPAAPRRLKPDLDRALEAIVLKCMEKEPRARYPTAAALADDLDRYLRGEATQSGRRRMPRRVARRWWMAAAIAAVAVLTTAGVVVATRRARESQEDAIVSVRATAKSCLEAALDLRRAGKEEGMEEYARRIEEACAKVADRPEAKQILGRLRRAQMRDEEALKLQDEAIAGDPGLAAARYERAVLNGRKLRRLLEAIYTRMYREYGVQTTDDLNAAHRRAAEAVAKDDVVRRLRAAIAEDLAVLEKAEFPAGERACVAAFRLWTTMDSEEALNAFRQALRVEPRLEEATEALAYLLQVRGRYAEAVDTWTRAIDADAGYLPFREGRARSCLQYGEKPGADQKRVHDLADADAAELIRRRPSEARYRVLRAEVRSVLVLGGREELYDVAMEDLGEALRLDPRSAEAYGQRGALKSNRASRQMTVTPESVRLAEEAEEDFGRALAIQPDDINAIRWRGITRLNMARFRSDSGEDPGALLKGAHEDFTKLVETWPGLVIAWIQRGEVRWRLAVEEARRGGSGVSTFQQAIKDLEMAIDMDPRDWEPHYGMALAAASWAVALAARGTDEQSTLEVAVLHGRKAVELEPQEVRAHLLLGDVRVRVAQSRQRRGQDPSEAARLAVADFTEAIRLGRGEAVIWFGRAQAYSILQEFEAADRDFTEALKRSPGWAMGLVRRGELRWTWGRARGKPEMYFKALEDLEKAVQLAPSSVEAWHELGLARSSIASEAAQDASESIRYERGALAAFEKVTALEPDKAQNWTFLGGTQVNLGIHLMHAGEPPLELWRAAIESLDRALKLDAKDPSAWLFRGNAFISRGDFRVWKGETAKDDYTEALRCFEKAGELNPAMKAALKSSIERCKAGLKP